MVHSQGLGEDAVTSLIWRRIRSFPLTLDDVFVRMRFRWQPENIPQPRSILPEESDRSHILSYRADDRKVSTRGYASARARQVFQSAVLVHPKSDTSHPPPENYEQGDHK